MRKAMMWATLLSVVGLMVWVGSAPAKEGAGAAVAAESGVKASAEKGDAAPGQASTRGGEREGARGGEEGGYSRQGGRPSGVGQVVMAAVTVPWAKENPDIQALVDKVVADQKALQASQAEQNDAIAAFVLASRGTDKDAIAAARKVLDAAIVKANADNRAMTEDMRALNGKMQELNPNRERPAAPKAAPTGEEAPKKQEGEGGAKRSGAKEG